MVADQLGVPEIRSVVGLKVAKLPQEARYLGDDSKQVVGGWMVVHFKTFDGLVVLYHWVEGSLFELLPVAT